MENSGDEISSIDSINETLWSARYDDSEKVAAGALQNLSRAEKSEYTRGIAYANLCLSAAYFLTSKNDLSLRHLSESLQWFRNNRAEKGYVRAMLLEGNIFESFGDYEKTLSLWLEALKVARQIGAVVSEAEACSQLGLVYFRLSDYKKSLEYLNTGLKIREELNDENAVASSLNRIGMVLRQTKEYDQSLSFYFRSLSIREKNNQLSAVPWTLLGIASTYEEMGSYEYALKYYTQGSSGGDRRCILQCLTGTGRIYSRMGESDKAEKLLNESLVMARELKTTYLIAESYAALSQHYESTGESGKALENYKLLQKTRESLLSEESQSRLRNIEITHAIEKSEQEKEIYRLRNVELKRAYDIIEEKNKDITASINYARRIQHALLPQTDDLKCFGDNIFILYLPKDIVSGDFYWIAEGEGEIVVAAGDCTGHGVPGALMSMLGISFLEEIVNKRGVSAPALILDELSAEVRRSLRQKSDCAETKDGMDISLCSIDRKTSKIRYAGANNNIYLISEGVLTEYRADRMCVGYNDTSSSKFSEQTIPAKKKDSIYLFSDGYADQFGGPFNKKFKYSSLKELLTRICHLPMEKQKEELASEFRSWKGETEQVDDVMIIGFRL